MLSQSTGAFAALSANPGRPELCEQIRSESSDSRNEIKWHLVVVPRTHVTYCRKTLPVPGTGRGRVVLVLSEYKLSIEKNIRGLDDL